MKNNNIFSFYRTGAQTGRLIPAALTSALMALTLTLASLPARADAKPHGAPTCAQVGTWFAPINGKTLNGPNLMSRSAHTGVVLLGETHDNPDHHRWQMQVLAALHARNPNMVLVFESFPRQSQPALDKWIQGSLGEQDFLDQSRWFDVWRFEPALYMPLFHFARLNRIPMIAMNVERSFIRRVGREGFDAVPEDLREGVSRPAPASPAYLRYLATVFGGHGGKKGEGDDATDPLKDTLDNPAFQYFAEAQTTWDRAMAERLAEVRGGGGKPLVVGIVGRGHLDYGYGIPHQLRALGVNDVTVMTPWDRARPCGEMRDSDGTAVADAAFALMTPAKPMAPAKPRLGVIIRTLEDQGDDGSGVIIDKVVAGSVAEETGLREGDIIVSAAGQTVSTTRALIAIIKAQAPGSWLPLEIRRDGRMRDRIAKFPPPRTDKGASMGVGSP